MKRSLLILIVLSVSVLSVALSACFYSYMPCPAIYYDSVEELEARLPDFYYFDDFTIETTLQSCFSSSDEWVKTAYQDYSEVHFNSYTIYYDIPEKENENYFLINCHEIKEGASSENVASADSDTSYAINIDGIECFFATKLSEYEGYRTVTMGIGFNIENCYYNIILYQTQKNSTSENEPFNYEYTLDDFPEMVTPAIINRHKGGETNVL